MRRSIGDVAGVEVGDHPIWRAEQGIR